MKILWYSKNSNIIIFQSPHHSKQNCLLNATKICLLMVHFILHQYLVIKLFITRVYAPEINSFYTTSLSILNNKEQATYELLFEELKKKMQVTIIIIL